jgi:hypothetical protein
MPLLCANYQLPDYTRECQSDKEKIVGLGKQERMKLVHEAVIEGREIFETFGARFFEPFEEEDLGARVDLFQELAQLGHGVAAGWDTEDIVHEALDELLSEILTAEVALREFS